MQEMPKTSEEIFDDTKFWERVEERKAYLEKQLQGADRGDAQFTRAYSWKNSTEQLLEYLEKHRMTQEHANMRLRRFSTEPPSAIFMSRGGQERKYDYLCVEYYHLYRRNADKTKVRRYTYFEVYYDTCLLSCLMAFPAFHKNQAFDALDMDRAEWAALKQQLDYWSGVLLPVLEELDEICATNFNCQTERLTQKHATRTF